MIRTAFGLAALVLATIGLVLWVLAWRGDVAPQVFAVVQLFTLAALAALALRHLLDDRPGAPM